MTFQQLQNATIQQRFTETQRGDVKNWLNHAYGQLWGMDEWVFRSTTALVGVTRGSSAVSLVPPDLGPVLSFYRDDGTPLLWRSPRDFFGTYYAQTATGVPEAYTIINKAINVGPISSVSSTTYQLSYERAFVEMVNDSDVPALPSENHLTIVSGACAYGLRLENDPTWQPFQAAYDDDVQRMRRNYLADQRGGPRQFGADPTSYLTYG